MLVACSLAALPAELIIIIAKQLPVASDLVKLSLTNSRLHMLLIPELRRLRLQQAKACIAALRFASPAVDVPAGLSQVHGQMYQQEAPDMTDIYEQAADYTMAMLQQHCARLEERYEMRMNSMSQSHPGLSTDLQHLALLYIARCCDAPAGANSD